MYGKIQAYPNGDEVYIAEVVFVCSNYQGELKEQETEVLEQRFFDSQSLPDNISPMNVEVLQRLVEKMNL